MMQELNKVDLVAAAMAASAGQVWDQLNAYPGFLRNRWREEARRMLASLAVAGRA